MSMARFFSATHRVTLVDFFGFGATPHPEYPLFIDDYSESIINLIRHYKMHKVSLISHSFGGRVALMVAFKAGYLLDKMVLCDSAGIKPRRGLKYHFKVKMHKILTKLRIPHKSGSADYRNLSPLMKQTFKNIVNDDLTCTLSKISLPVLIIWGSKDKDTPIYMARKFLRKIVGSGLVVFKGAGHFAYLTEQAAVERIVWQFFEGDNEFSNYRRDGGKRSNSVIKIPCVNTRKQL